MLHDENRSKDSEDIERIFIKDIRARIGTIALCLIQMNEHVDQGIPIDEEQLDCLLREFHTVKACAEFDDISVLARIAHHVEDLLLVFKHKHLEPGRVHYNLLYSVIDYTLQLFGDLDIPQADIDQDADEIIHMIDCAQKELELQGGEKELAVEDKESVYISHHQDDLDHLDERLLGKPDVAAVKEQLDIVKHEMLQLEDLSTGLREPALRALAAFEELEDVFVIDLPDGLAELLNGLLDVLKVAVQCDSKPDGCDLGVLSDVIVVVRNCCADLLQGGDGQLPGFRVLNEMVADIRWQLRVNIPRMPLFVEEHDEEPVPLKKIADNMKTIIQRAARELQKEVEAHVDADDSSVSSSWAHKLNIVLVHLIRNALDHGIEGVEDRKKAGKKAIGNIWFTAKTDGGVLRISVRDDGRGLDETGITDEALRQEQDGHEEWKQTKAVDLIMCPGFSTVREPTLYSGRGMGMHIVSQNIHALGGELAISSESGEGTTFVITVPLAPSSRNHRTASPAVPRFL